MSPCTATEVPPEMYSPSFTSSSVLVRNASSIRTLRARTNAVCRFVRSVPVSWHARKWVGPTGSRRSREVERAQRSQLFVGALGRVSSKGLRRRYRYPCRISASLRDMDGSVGMTPTQVRASGPSASNIRARCSFDSAPVNRLSQRRSWSRAVAARCSVVWCDVVGVCMWNVAGA